ncbi:class I SAM-dependent methyltransferase [Streptomyces montanisoli]|uniref:Class I SAM-dependent methyltransferase n=1 Tax=Streptomyces montanisoli TaxID=2798581 RepID=A0A940M786_9ACTN|nr:class I SAM-dependent methyltransferase [Streptomyces montanisoli]MBP0456079.1 class I SAM-dependent methyltransferase [Streptomyces montanisoli]
MDTDATATRQELQHPRFARQYLKLAVQADRRGGVAHRRRLLDGLTGRVLEVGAGQGSNFPHYPDAVTEVVAVEPDDTLRAAALRAATKASATVTVVAGHCGELPITDSGFDAVVFSLVLCSVPGQAAALAEGSRVLRRGGQLRFYEHVRSPHRVGGLLEDAITPLWRRIGGGCHPNRDTEAAIRAAGFTIEAIDHFGFAPSPLMPRTSHIIGTATKPRA